MAGEVVSQQQHLPTSLLATGRNTWENQSVQVKVSNHPDLVLLYWAFFTPPLHHAAYQYTLMPLYTTYGGSILPTPEPHSMTDGCFGMVPHVLHVLGPVSIERYQYKTSPHNTIIKDDPHTIMPYPLGY